MPVILTEESDFDTWLSAPADEALRLQRPLAAGVLKIVLTRPGKDEAIAA